MNSIIIFVYVCTDGMCFFKYNGTYWSVEREAETLVAVAGMDIRTENLGGRSGLCTEHVWLSLKDLLLTDKSE